MSGIVVIKKRTVRNFRIQDSVWALAREKAGLLGVNMTFLVEKLLQDFAQNSQIVIHEPEVMEVPENLEIKIEKLADLLSGSVLKKQKMLVIPFSIQQKELYKVQKYFSEDDIIKMAQKIKNGLGGPLKNLKEYRVIKLKTTFRGVVGRSVFFMVTKNGGILPILIRLKKDEIGKNMTFQDQNFAEIFKKNVNMIFKDLKKGNFRTIEI